MGLVVLGTALMFLEANVVVLETNVVDGPGDGLGGPGNSPGAPRDGIGGSEISLREQFLPGLHIQFEHCKGPVGWEKTMAREKWVGQPGGQC
jgi:hypothetical protein